MIQLDISSTIIAVAFFGWAALCGLVVWVYRMGHDSLMDIDNVKLPKIWEAFHAMQKENQESNQKLINMMNQLHVLMVDNYAKKDDLEKTAGMPTNELKLVNSTFIRNVDCLERSEKCLERIDKRISVIERFVQDKAGFYNVTQ